MFTNQVAHVRTWTLAQLQTWLMKHGLQGLQSAVPRQPPQLSAQQSQSLFDEARSPRIAKYKATTESRLAVSSGEFFENAGPSWSRANGTTSIAATAVAKSADEIRPPGVTKYRCEQFGRAEVPKISSQENVEGVKFNHQKRNSERKCEQFGVIDDLAKECTNMVLREASYDKEVAEEEWLDLLHSLRNRMIDSSCVSNAGVMVLQLCLLPRRLRGRCLHPE